MAIRTTRVLVRDLEQWEKCSQGKLLKLLKMNKIPMVKEPPNGVVKSGSFGTYYQLSKSLGVKVDNSGYEDLKGLKKELKHMRKCSMFAKHLVHKVYGIVELRTLDGDVRLGILIEHIDGCEAHRHNGFQQSVRNKLLNKLYDQGVDHSDLHSSNIMWDKRKKMYRAIDLDSQFVSIL
jgi:hypothetical protein